MRLGLFLIILVFTNLAFAQGQFFTLDEVRVNCDLLKTCELLKPRFLSFQGKQFDAKALKFELKTRLFEELIDQFSYSVEMYGEKNILEINLTTRKIIGDISIKSSIKGVPTDSLEALLPVQEGEYFNSDLVSAIPTALSKYLFDLGIVDSEIDLKLVPNDGEVKIEINILSAKIVRIKKIKWYYFDKRNIERIKKELLKLGGKIFNRKEINLMIDQISKDIFDEGYPFSYLKQRASSFTEDKTGVILEFDLRLGDKILFDIQGNNLLSKNLLLSQIKEKFRDQVDLDKGQIRKNILNEIDDAYREIGIFNTKAKINIIEGYSPEGEKVRTYFIRVFEGHKIKIEDIFFTGNRHFSDEFLRNIYFKEGTALSNNKNLDLQFLEKYKQLIFEKYLQNGFVNVEITPPKVNYLTDKKATIFMAIKEHKQTMISEIKLSSPADELFKDQIQKVISNKVGSPLNVLLLDSDLEEIEKYIKNKGYPFVKIKNKDADTALTYDSTFTEARLFVDIELGKKSYLNTFYVSGNIKTKEEVFEREFTFKKGDLLTGEMINHFIDRISSTGLFKEIKVHPRPVESIPFGEDSQLVDLVVEVVERDSSMLELGPGFRTDLGARLTAKYKMINLSGLGRRLSFRGELNQRLDEESALAPERRGKYPLAFLEYFVDGKYEEPYLGGKEVGMDLLASVGRRRYRTFDSDIFLSGVTLSESTSWFVPLIRYQYENDFQYNAAYEKDQGTFRIGSITPSFSFDFRDRRINPTKGIFLSLIGEYASPWLGSIDANNYKINFFSVISRNNFYYPFGYNWIGAMYLSAGYQRNLETELLTDSSGNPVLDENGIPTTVGYIPTVKVFRLEGMDNVRGWRNSEVNILSNGKDISQVVVNDTAYYLNIKLEARYFLNDNFVIYPFFDAGSIQVNQWVPFQLKTGTGIGFRYLTPMGSLELDLGVKTHRGAGQSFGTINLMIGYF